MEATKKRMAASPAPVKQYSRRRRTSREAPRRSGSGSGSPPKSPSTSEDFSKLDEMTDKIVSVIVKDVEDKLAAFQREASLDKLATASLLTETVNASENYESVMRVPKAEMVTSICHTILKHDLDN